MGKLSQAQVQRVREYAERAPLADELRDRDRKRLQKEVIAIVRAREATQAPARPARQLGARPRAGLRRGARRLARAVLRPADGHRPFAHAGAARPRAGATCAATPKISRRSPRDERPEAPAGACAGSGSDCLRRPHALYPARIRGAARQPVDRHRLHPRSALLPVQPEVRRDVRLRSRRADRHARRDHVPEPRELPRARPDRHAASSPPGASSTSSGKCGARTARPSSAG